MCAKFECRPALYLAFLVLAGLLAFTMFEYANASLINKDLRDVDLIKVTHYLLDKDTVLSSKENLPIVSELYNSIVSTKTATYRNPGELERQESDPMFELIVYYKDGTSEHIVSTETGRFVFRPLSDSGWVGGENIYLIELIEDVLNRK